METRGSSSFKLKYCFNFFLSFISLFGIWSLFRRGPRPPKSPLVPQYKRFQNKSIANQWELSEWENILKVVEFNNRQIKPDNHGRVLWGKGFPASTEVVFLYFHGFGASPCEALEVCQALGRKYKANVYLPRLIGHGMDGKDALGELTAENYLESACKALEDALQAGIIVDHALGIISCSNDCGR